MAKKSRVKSEPVAEEKVSEPGQDLFVPTPEQGGIVDFFSLFNAIGILMALIMIADLLLHNVFHII